jgi:hypothetical protein
MAPTSNGPVNSEKYAALVLVVALVCVTIICVTCLGACF